MKTYGVIIWMKPRTGAMIIWCADSAGLVYAPDSVGRQAAAQGVRVGDTVDLELVSVGHGMRMCATIEKHGTGGGARLVKSLDGPRGAVRRAGPVISRDGALSASIGFGADMMRSVRKGPPANRGPRVA